MFTRMIIIFIYVVVNIRPKNKLHAYTFHQLNRNLLSIRLQVASPFTVYSIPYAKLGRVERTLINNHIFVKLGFTFVARITYLLKHLDVYTEVTPQQHIIFLLESFVILANAKVYSAAVTRTINASLRQNGALTLCVTFINVFNNQALVQTLRSTSNIIALPLHYSFNNLSCFIFMGPADIAPHGVNWEVISVMVAFLVCESTRKNIINETNSFFSPKKLAINIEMANFTMRDLLYHFVKLL